MVGRGAGGCHRSGEGQPGWGHPAGSVLGGAGGSDPMAGPAGVAPARRRRASCPAAPPRLRAIRVCTQRRTKEARLAPKGTREVGVLDSRQGSDRLAVGDCGLRVQPSHGAIQGKLAFGNELARQRVIHIGEVWSSLYESEAAARKLLRSARDVVGDQGDYAAELEKLLVPLQSESERNQVCTADNRCQSVLAGSNAVQPDASVPQCPGAIDSGARQRQPTRCSRERSQAGKSQNVGHEFH